MSDETIIIDGGFEIFEINLEISSIREVIKAC